MHPSTNMNDDELRVALKPLIYSENWPYLLEFISRLQAAQVKRAMSIVEPHEIYRSQGRVHAYDQVLSLNQSR